MDSSYGGETTQDGSETFGMMSSFEFQHHTSVFTFRNLHHILL